MSPSKSVTALLVGIMALVLAVSACRTAPSPASGGTAAPEALPADPGKLIDRVIEAYGGREALARVQSYAFAGTLLDRATFHSNPEQVPFTRTFARKDRLKVVITRSEGSEVRILDGDKGWRSGRTGDNLASVEGPAYQAMVLQAARADLPWLLLDKGPEIRSAPPLRLSEKDKEGQVVTHTLAVLVVPLRDGMSLKVLVEEKSARIWGVAAYDTDERARPPVFETHYTGFDKEDGILFPIGEITFVGKMQTGTIFINTVKINPPLDKDEFKP